MKLSLLLPAYNVADYIEECLDALAPQLTTDVELLVVDDTSTDATLQVIERWQRQRQVPVQVLRHPENRGLSQARNTLFAQSRGRYVWFIDSDDIPKPGSVHRLLQTIDQHGPDVIVFDFETRDERQSPDARQWGRIRRRQGFEGRAHGRHTPAQAAARTLFSDKLYAWNKVFRRDRLTQPVFPPGRYFEDMALSTHMLLSSQATVLLREALITYRQRPGSIVDSLSTTKIADWVHAVRAVAAAGHLATPQEPVAELSLHYCVQANLLEVMSHTAHRDVPELAPEALCLTLKELTGRSPNALCWALVRRLQWRAAIRLAKKVRKVRHHVR